MPYSQFDDEQERWEGVAVPQGQYIYTIHRSIDKDQSSINNLKFSVLDDLSFSSEETDDGLQKLYLLSGLAMIGINFHNSGNAFVCVLERIKEARKFPVNPVPLHKLPAHVQSKLEEKESKFIYNNDFS